MRILTKELLIKEYVENRKPARKIASELGYTHTSIYDHLKKFGIESRHKQSRKSIGQRFGSLTIFAKAIGKDKWLCKCDCGSLKEYYGSSFDGGTTQSCGCYKKSLVGNNSPYWKGCGEIGASFWTDFLRYAKRRDIPVKIDIKFAWDLLRIQNEKCSLSDLPIKITHGHRSGSTASIDRIDNKVGYIEENVQWLHVDVNYMKWKFDTKYFLELCEKCTNKRDIKNIAEDCCLCKRTANFKGYKCITGVTWNRIKIYAEDRNLEFDLNIQDIWDIYVKQKGLCILSGLKINFEENSKRFSQKTASLDRIDSSRGYVTNNVQWVHKDVNMMKNDFTQPYFLELCRLVTDFNATKLAA